MDLTPFSRSRYVLSLGIVVAMGAFVFAVGAGLIAIGESYWVTMEGYRVPELALEHGLVKTATEQNAWPPW